MFGHTNSLQILTYLLILSPLLASAQPSRPGNGLVATNTPPQGVVKAYQSQDSVPIQLEESGHYDKRRRSQEGQKMEDLSASPRLPRPGRVVRVEGSSPQQESVRPAWNANPLFSPAGPGTTTHSEITPVEDEVARPPYAPSSPRPGGSTHSEITPVEDGPTRLPYAPSSPRSGESTHPATVPVSLAAERWPPGVHTSSSTPRLGSTTHSEIGVAADKAEIPSSPHTPPSPHSPHSTHSPHSPTTPHAPFETETPQNRADTRRRCAALRRVFDTSGMNDEERRSAKFCCKFLVGSCMVGIGAGVRNQIGAGVAIGGAVSYLYALQDLHNPKKKTTATAAPAVPTDLPVKHRRRLERRRQGMPEPAPPPSNPRAGMNNQLETASAEEGTRRFLHSVQAFSDSPRPPLSPPSPKSQAVIPPSSRNLPASPGRRPNTSPPNGSPTRRHCAALEHLNPTNMTPEQKGIAKFCCKYFASVCLVAGGVMSEYHKAAAPIIVGGMVTGISGTWDLHNAVVPSGDQGREEEMHPLENVLRRRRVEGLKQRASPPATPRAGSSNQAEVGPVQDEEGWTLLHSPTTSPGNNPKMSKTPQTPKTLQPLAFASPAIASPIRSRCAALQHLSPASWTREQKNVAKFCCKYFVSFCMITAGAIHHEPAATVPLVLGGVAAGISGAGDLRQAMRTSGRPRSRVDTTNAMHPLGNVLRKRNRLGLRRRGGQVHKRATPPSTPRAGTTSQAEIAPAEAEGSELVPSAHAASNPPPAVSLQASSPLNPQRQPQVPSPPHPPSGSPRRQPLIPFTPGTASSFPNITPPASASITTPAIAHLQRSPPTRRTCAALTRQLDPRTLTPEERKFASFCCKYFVGFCLVSTGALSQLPYVRWPLVSTGMAVEGSGAVDLYGMFKARQQRRQREAQQLRDDLREPREARPRQAPRREIPMYTIDLPAPPVKRRSLDGWGKRGLGQGASPLRGPSPGSSSQAGAAPAEEGRLLPSSSSSPPPNTGPAIPQRQPQTLSNLPRQETHTPSPPRTQSPPRSPPGSPRASTPPALELATPNPSQRPTRGTCTALASRLYPADLTVEERQFARFCCKYFAAACLLGAAALSSTVNPNLGLTLGAGGLVAGVSGAVDWQRAVEARMGRVQPQEGNEGGMRAGARAEDLHPFANVLRRRN